MSPYRSRITRLAMLALALAGCTVGPDYDRPAAPAPALYKELEGWRIATPQDTAERGAWWLIYGDPLLDDLVRQVAASNQTLKAAQAAYRQANALVRQARAGLFPVLTAGGAVDRAQRASSGGASLGGGGRTATSYDLSLDASWVPDLWGRVRRSVEGNVASAEARAADMADVRLAAEAALAGAYLQLRVTDALQRLLDATVEAFDQSLAIARNRVGAGVASYADVAQALAQLEQARSQAVAVGVGRAQLEHAIAALIGRPPAELAIAATTDELRAPAVPPGVPTSLLERRPDIAAAERDMAAANAAIGVAEAAYYPDLTLSGSLGWTGSALDNLFRASSQVWALGARLAGTLFDGGARGARVDAARALYDQTVALYRQTVLTAFQQVEDQLATLRILAEQWEVQAGAVQAAREAERLVLNQYAAGTVPYTSVLTAQTTALASEQTALNILRGQLIASVALIQALGGGWTGGDLPAR
ncbi:MAG: efflux transporter outer membrane subunit [Alphaproteobacteria bacterium]|nr:efflux transporter outer membrane subunit [Alphaproteobacteria bacterium]